MSDRAERRRERREQQRRPTPAATPTRMQAALQWLSGVRAKQAEQAETRARERAEAAGEDPDTVGEPRYAVPNRRELRAAVRGKPTGRQTALRHVAHTHRLPPAPSEKAAEREARRTALRDAVERGAA